MRGTILGASSCFHHKVGILSYPVIRCTPKNKIPDAGAFIDSKIVVLWEYFKDCRRDIQLQNVVFAAVDFFSKRHVAAVERIVAR